MSILGLRISLGKSFLSSRWVEFAKKTIFLDNNLDYACIGPRLVLNAVLNKFYNVHLISSLVERRLVDSFELASKMTKSPKRISSEHSRFGLLLLFGPLGSVIRNGFPFSAYLRMLRKEKAHFGTNFFSTTEKFSESTEENILTDYSLPLLRTAYAELLKETYRKREVAANAELEQILILLWRRMSCYS